MISNQNWYSTPCLRRGAHKPEVNFWFAPRHWYNTATMSNPNDPNLGGTIHNPLAVMQEGEKIIFEVRRHPIGLI